MDKVTAQAIADIAANNYAGAAEIAEQGAEVLLRCARTGDAPSLEVFRQELLMTIWGLIHAQPSMAPLVNLVNEVLWKIESLDSLRTLRQTVVDITSDFKRQLHVHEAAIAESVLPLIPEGAQVLTNSRSTTVRAALRHAQRAGRRFSVTCAEGRPGYEGRKMATELAEDGIPVTLMIDALAGSYVPRMSLVLVGADHLTSRGLMNKAGTYSLALAAHANNVPIYALCSSNKFLPPGYTPPIQTHWPAEQVWEEPPAGITIKNLYFDCTPLTELAGLVTEQGVLPTAGIEGWLASIKLHPALMRTPESIEQQTVGN
ncbi:MAG: translation initiation factor eIF-2B [Chloroflexaceae bacterium]